MKQMYLQLSVAVLWLLVFTYLSFWGKKKQNKCSSVALIVSEVLSIYTKITCSRVYGRHWNYHSYAMATALHPPELTSKEARAESQSAILF